MKGESHVTHEFVDFIPDDLQDGTIYISMKYCTAVHRCCCGCGREVVTPLSPTAWKLTFDGETVSLYPSIGSWNLPCQSHYFITKSEVLWARKWTKNQIERGRKREARAKEIYHSEKQRQLEPPIKSSPPTPPNSKVKKGS